MRRGGGTASLLLLAAALSCRGDSGERAPARPPAPSIRVVTPRGELDQAPTSFAWEPVQGARSYRVKIADSDAVWPLFVRSSDHPVLLLDPKEASAAFLADRVHEWEIEALDERGELLASGWASFLIRAPAP